MGTTRTIWHVMLKTLLTQRAPPRFEVRGEVQLSSEPLRADYLLLRRQKPEEGEGQTLRKLWGFLPKDTILEFKSTGRPYRARNLDRLWAYLHLHYTDEPKRLEQRNDLCGALLVPTRTPSLDADVGSLGLAWHDRGAGYWELTGGPFALYVLEIDEVAEAEDDDLLRSLGHNAAHTLEGKLWFLEQTGATVEGIEMNGLEGYEEAILKAVAKLPPEHVLATYKPEQRVADLSPEQRLAGLAPEQRLAGLSPEQALLALPDETLRTFPDSYLATLAEPTRAAIRARIGR
ncbi:MAG: hypothetical protein ABI134_08190 [Byssovorax sp.]